MRSAALSRKTLTVYWYELTAIPNLILDSPPQQAIGAQLCHQNGAQVVGFVLCATGDNAYTWRCSSYGRLDRRRTSLRDSTTVLEYGSD